MWHIDKGRNLFVGRFFMIQYYQIADGRIQEAESASANVFLISSPTLAERSLLTERWNLDEHNVNSALDPDEISRLEFEDDHTMMILKRPRSYSADNQFQFKVSSVGVFLFADKMVILVDSDAPWFWQDKRFARITNFKMMTLRILGYCTDHFMGHLKVISQISDELEQQINDSMENKYLIYLFTLNKGLVYYLKAISSNMLLLQKMTTANKSPFSEEEKEMLEDLTIDNSQCHRIAEIYSNILASMMDARASIVGNNLNILMNRLNIITVAIMLPTFVVSLFSMNVPLPMPGPDQPVMYQWPFITVLCLCGILTVLFFFFFLRYKKH